jgi:ABC-type nitrate/sulfonate/bicarbonate transport system substrate-binding protein
MVLKKYGLENAVGVRQMGGTVEVSAAFQKKQIGGAVTSSLRVDASAQPRLLLKLEDMGFQYSMDVVAHSRDDLKRFPHVVEGMVRAYTEGVAAIHSQKDRAYKAIAKYARLRDEKKIEEIYQDFDYVSREDAACRARGARFYFRVYGQEGSASRYLCR